MAAVAIGTGVKLVNLIPEFAKLFYYIYSALNSLRAEDHTVDQVCERAYDIRRLLEKYKEHWDSSVAEQLKKIIDDNYKKLEWYVMKCDNIKKEGFFKRFRHALTKSNTEMLQDLNVLLDRIYQNINGHALHAVSTQVGRLSSSVSQKSGAHSVRSDLGTLKVPSKVDRPEVYMEGPQLHIKVNDCKNNREHLDEYHISINKQWSHTLKRRIGFMYDTAIIEPEGMNPPLEPGKVYSFQARAKNAKGLGEWSDSTDIRLNTGILGKPDKPSIVSEVGTGVVKVKVAIPKTYVNHVTEVLCQHHDKENGGKWISESFKIPKNPDAHDHTVTLTECSPYAYHYLRVVFINKFGESEPSDTVDIAPAVPGAPTKVRRSSNYTSSMIKLRWKPPELGKEFVDQYLIRYKRKKDMDKVDVHFLVIKVQKNKFSARATNLKSDTDYIFLISGVNADGVSGPAVSIEADTRWKKAAKAALSPFVFLGGTVASTAGLLTGPVSGPIIGAVSGGALGVVLPESKPGAVAGGTAGTVGGAVAGAAIGTVAAIGSPVIGPIMGGMMAHEFVHGGSISDQSDDDDAC